MGAPVANKGTCAAGGTRITIPDCKRRYFQVEGSGEQSRESVHGKIAILETGGAAGHVELAKNPDGGSLIEDVMKTLHPGAVAGDRHTGVDEFLRWPGQNEVNLSGPREQRFKKQDIGT